MTCRYSGAGQLSKGWVKRSLPSHNCKEDEEVEAIHVSRTLFVHPHWPDYENAAQDECSNHWEPERRIKTTTLGEKLRISIRLK